MLKKFKNLQEQNFEGEANKKQWDNDREYPKKAT